MNSIIYIPEKYHLIQHLFQQLFGEMIVTNELSDEVTFAIIPITSTEDERRIKYFVSRSIYPIIISDRAILLHDFFPHIGYNVPEIITLQALFSSRSQNIMMPT